MWALIVSWWSVLLVKETPRETITDTFKQARNNLEMVKWWWPSIARQIPLYMTNIFNIAHANESPLITIFIHIWFKTWGLSIFTCCTLSRIYGVHFWDHENEICLEMSLWCIFYFLVWNSRLFIMKGTAPRKKNSSWYKKTQ